MKDIALLKKKIVEVQKREHISFAEVAKRAKMSRSTLYDRLRGKGDFTIEEADGLRIALNLSLEEFYAIFFPDWVVNLTT